MKTSKDDQILKTLFRDSWVALKQFKHDHLTAPSKFKTVQALKVVLERAKQEDLQLIALALKINSKGLTETALRLEILHVVTSLVNSHTSYAWNRTLNVAAGTVLFYLVTLSTPYVNQFAPDSVIRVNLENLLLLIKAAIALYGTWAGINYLGRLNKSWSIRLTLRSTLEDMVNSGGGSKKYLFDDETRDWLKENMVDKPKQLLIKAKPPVKEHKTPVKEHKSPAKKHKTPAKERPRNVRHQHNPRNVPPQMMMDQMYAQL